MLDTKTGDLYSIDNNGHLHIFEVHYLAPGSYEIFEILWFSSTIRSYAVQTRMGYCGKHDGSDCPEYASSIEKALEKANKFFDQEIKRFQDLKKKIEQFKGFKP